MTFRRITPSSLTALATALLAVLPDARADVTPLHWYRMGEVPTLPVGRTVTSLPDSIGTATLTAGTGAGVFRISDQVSTQASTHALSSRCLSLSSPGAYAQGPLLGADTDDFGFETWFACSDPSGAHGIAANGAPGTDGWDLALISNKLVARLGSAGAIETALQSTAQTHVALVRTQGVTTLYVNGQPRGSSSAALTPPTGRFTLGGTPSSTGVTRLLYGFLDEARYFKTGANFDPALDLLANIPRIRLSLASTAAATNGSVYDMGETAVGGSSHVNFSVSDGASPASGSSSSPFRISSVTLSGPDVSSFSLSYSSYYPKNTASGSVEFHPDSPGVKSAILTVISNDPDNSTYTITLQATAVQQPRITLFAGTGPATAPPIADGGTPVVYPATSLSGTGVEKTFTIRNDGLADLHLGSISLFGSHAADFTVTSSPAATTLAVGASTTFIVRFSPGAAGYRSGTVAIDSDAFNAARFHIALAGTGAGPEIQLAGSSGEPLHSHTVITWGNADFDQDAVPPGLGAVTAVSAGDDFTAALRTDGTVVVWGRSPVTQEIPGLTHVTAISGSGGYLLALRSDGSVAAWGRNDQGQCNVPAGLAGVTAISAGNGHALALKNDGTVAGWGRYGSSPISIPSGLSGVVAISAGSQYSLAVKSDGSVVAWNQAGLSNSLLPANLPPLTAVASAVNESFGLTSDGIVIHWSPYLEGYEILFPATAAPFTSLSGSGSGVLLTAVRSDGSFASWSAIDGYPQAQPPVGLTHVVALAPGSAHIAALYDSRIDFGAIDTAHSGPAKTFTVTNSGTAPLHLASATLTGPGAASYALDAAGLATTTLASGERTTFTVSFTPQGPGQEDASLRILSDAAGHPAFTVDLTAAAFTLATPLDAWRFQHFATTAESGDSADDADPNHNGIPNLLEYALGGDPAGNTTGTAILPKYAIDGSSSTFTFDRYPDRSDIVLTLQASDTLAADSWQDLARSTSGAAFTSLAPQATLSEIPAGESVHVTLTDTSPSPALLARFLRLQATRP